MDKLLELLNEREKEERNQTYEWSKLGDFILAENIQTNQDMDSSESVAILISKSYGFIQWLVDNDKIDFEKDKYAVILYKDGNQDFIPAEDELVMELAIQSNPVEYLISILK